jgi:SAM-dependent methyltransferase
MKTASQKIIDSNKHDGQPAQQPERSAARQSNRCRFCAAPLKRTFVDLGMSPLCESYLSVEQLNQMEPFYPLHVFVCDKCFLVQLLEYVKPEHIFTEYAYFSSFSDSWLQHASNYVDMISSRLGLGANSLVIEIASNDGYLLKNFLPKGIPVLGIEPAINVAQTAIQKGIPSVTEFFGCELARKLAREGRQADLLLGNNVLAHVPDINDFVGGMRLLLKPRGVITMEFPHLLRLIERNQYDTIYHEHFSYLSLSTTERIFNAHGLRIFDVEELSTHGGSLRIYACHLENNHYQDSPKLLEVKSREASEGFGQIDYYSSFGEKVIASKRNLLDFFIQAKRNGKNIAGYGAPGKGNTLLNYCGIRTDFLDYTVDRNPYKHGKFLPGSRIPIFPPERIAETKPDFIFILPWNLKDEIISQLSYVRQWGGKFVVPIPDVAVVE